MNEIRTPGPAVLVGIDGSRSAVRAALWAVDEALHRRLPLRLVHVTPQTEFPEFSDERSPAGTAVRHAFRQIGATHKPVKVEAEIRHGRVADVLLDASRSAVMLCVGAIGISGADTRKVGSTAAEVLRSVRCPVAVIRDDPSSRHGPSAVVVEIDESHESVAPLELAAHEARLRAAPLRVLLRHRPISLSGQRVTTLTRVDRRVAAVHVERRLAPLRVRYPDLDIRALDPAGGTLDYLERQGHTVQLVVVGAGDAAHVQELVGPNGCGVLGRTHCSVLIAERQRLL
ncbi:universal stress protein [Mycobacteroides abscessus]|uniref:Universal stress protein n=1 Tax=Mycobacteroides abscessus subsp. bolletii TaxID=319705 RepID=A0A9Q7SBR9_9MYCO|nr:universal stress protein [Mycobacteroides abscessus]AMU22602.1 universal stress protein [Mycobacteroides abscessus]MBN7302148.1 universal stress protein [Mycobacteroides abscessus subsp. bolletii]MDO2971881.1 universal stress protein [Mycobacteroides abscessus subsp. bolletii]MDO3076957.1 universal stress protein [Mycobacteroides abscessus subsp. bolletii]MDO3130136.1 universal stress protein [Mycobacteroides abscessus subsp. bolletii]